MISTWNKLKIFKVNKGDEELTFIQRLANENNWSHEYALRVYDEYLKFVYLAAASGKQVTPSDQVDQAWHLHLCYSDSYWKDLCKDVLGKELHHGPTKGGKKESQRFINQYEETILSYRNSFHTKPPVDIWPYTKSRFDSKNRFIRVNLKDSLVIPKIAIYLLSGLAALVLGWKYYIREAIAGEDTLYIVLMISIPIVLITLLFLLVRYNRNNRGGSTGCAGGGWQDPGNSCGTGRKGEMKRHV